MEKDKRLFYPSDDSFRMEKSVINFNNFDQLKSCSMDVIPETLLQYICYEHQYNIFGYGKLDPEEFANMFHFSFNFLVGKHPEPFQKKNALLLRTKLPADRNLRQRSSTNGIPFSDILCDNRIENALYILNTVPLQVVSTTIDEKNSMAVRTYESLIILEKFALVQDTKTGKITYRYKLNEKFRRNIASMYLTINRSSLIALRKSNLISLYIYLVNLREALHLQGRSMTTPDYTPDFNHLCEIAYINQSEDKFKKRDLNAALKKIDATTELHFTVNWVSRDSNRYKYIPIFDFGEYSRIKDNFFRNSERVMTALNEFLHNLVDSCPFIGDRYSQEAETFFSHWICSSKSEDIRLFSFALQKAFVDIGCGIPNDINERIALFTTLANSNRDDSTMLWAIEIFSGNRFKMPGFKIQDNRNQR